VTTPASDWDPASELSVNRPEDNDGQMRRTCPVAYSGQWGGFWSLFRHEDVTRAVRDTDSFLSTPTQVWPPMNTGAPWLPLQSDPPAHRQYRQPLVKFFRGERVLSFEPKITALTNQLIDGFIGQGSVDIARELNIPLPAMGMCLLLGLPESDWTYFYRWTTTIVDASTTGDMAAIGACFTEITDFADRWIVSRREDDKDDVVGAMLKATIDGQPWTDNEIRGTFILLFSAGHQTTADALTYAVRHLAAHPGDRRRLAENPDLIPDATVEFVRLSAPIRALARTTARDVEIGERTIPASSPVTMMWGAASRDETVFDCPDEFRPERDNRQMIAFGSGIHRCLGEELAKLEIRVVLRELLRRIPDFEIEGDGVRSSWPTNGYHSLLLKFPVREGLR
jgi:cytochrome P450